MSYQHRTLTIERIGQHTEVNQTSAGVWGIQPRLIVLFKGYPHLVGMDSSPERALYQVGDEVEVAINDLQADDVRVNRNLTLERLKQRPATRSR